MQNRLGQSLVFQGDFVNFKVNLKDKKTAASMPRSGCFSR